MPDVAARLQPRGSSTPFATMVLGVAVLLVLGGILGLNEAHRRAEVARIDRLAYLVGELTEAIGYGGFIHHFKNHVLRGDAIHRERAQAAWEQAERSLAELRVIGREAGLDVQFDALSATLRRYRDHLATAASGHEAGLSPGEIDRRVRIDDAPALAEARATFATIRAGIRSDVARLERRGLFLALLILTVTVGLVFLLHRSALRTARTWTALHQARVERKVLLEQVETLELFSAAAAHDLAGPLQVMQLSAEEALASLDSGDHRDRARDEARLALEDVPAQVARMRGLIDGLLRYARTAAEAGHPAEPNRERVAQSALAVRGALELHGGKRGPVLEIRGPFPPVRASQTEVDLLVRNVVENAIKYHDEPEAGRILIEGGDDGKTAWIRISDDGPGIPAHRHGEAFRPFVRLHDDDGRAAGTGLGLAIVERVARRLGGSVELQGNQPRGTRVTLRLPCAPVREGSRAASLLPGVF